MQQFGGQTAIVSKWDEPAVEARTELEPPPPTRPGVGAALQWWRLAPIRARPKVQLKVVVGSLALILVTALVCVWTLDPDSGSDGIALSRIVALDTAHLRWQFSAILLTLAAAHYVASAAATRAAAGIRLPIRELLLVQFAAAAANRITPGGLGGNALTTRYLTRRGLRLPASLGAISALVVFGALADLLVLIIMVTFGRWIALPVGLSAIASRLRRLEPPSSVWHSGWLWVAAIVVGALLWFLAQRYGERAWSFARDLLVPVRQLLTRPGRLCVLLIASGSTTLVLAFAFAATTTMVPGPHPHVGLGVLIVAFMLGSATASTVPVPAGLGSTEAALVAVLVGVGLPIGQAIQVVVIYRVVTFWAPAVLGVLVTRRLHRLGAV